MLKSKYLTNSLQYDPKKCIGCGLCAVVCPHNVFSIEDRLASLNFPEKCMECGACQKNCPTSAIQVDSGVGCAAAIIYSALTGKEEVTCGCGYEDDPKDNKDKAGSCCG
jgi:NAD-dependent dihydropyrimidine dehydrogenase PreA subunit